MTRRVERGVIGRRHLMARRANTRFVVVALIVLLAALATWAVFDFRSRTRPASAPASSGMSGMSGMEGMNMSADGSVQLTAGQLTQFGITFGTVDLRTLADEVRAVGVVTVDERRVAQVAPRFGGFAERLHVDFTGQAVRTGQPLLDIYSPELLAAQEELLVARQLERTMREGAVPGVPAGSSDLQSAARRRLRLWDISDAQIDQILASGSVRRTLTLYSPASGVVIEKSVSRGQAFQPGQTLYTIADLARVWIDVEFRESDIGSVREGSAATLELTSYPGRPLQGRVAYVYPTVQQESRTVKARIEVANADGRLKPGMYATVRITTPARSVLAAPASAIIRTGERSLAFADMGGGNLMPHEVETGRTAGDYVEILSGLTAGQRVVTSAQFLLESESNLAEVMRSMVGQTGRSGSGDMPGMDMGVDSGGAARKQMKMSPPSRATRPQP